MRKRRQTDGQVDVCEKGIRSAGVGRHIQITSEYDKAGANQNKWTQRLLLQRHSTAALNSLKCIHILYINLETTTVFSLISISVCGISGSVVEFQLRHTSFYLMRRRLCDHNHYVFGWQQ